MNPNTPNTNFELPVPQTDGSSNIELPKSGVSDSSIPNPENSIGKIGGKIQVSSAPPAQGANQAQSIPVSTNPQPLVPPTNSPLSADDADLIEKEWVIKAKQIVSATRDDPHKQNKEMSRFRADYLKKRYKKNIKIEES